jgi:hypothetical protein
MARSDPQTPFGRLEWRQPARTWQLGFQPVQKMPIIHVSSGFIRGIPVKGLSPAMAAGLSDTLWSVTDLAKMIDAAQPKPGKRGTYKKHAA